MKSDLSAFTELAMNMLRLTDLTGTDLARLQKYHAAYRRLLEHTGEDTW